MISQTRSLGILFIYLLSFLIGLPANLLALRAFVGRIRQPQPAAVHVLLLSLTLADLLLLLLLPFKVTEAAYNFRWPLGNFLCALIGFSFYGSIYCSTWLLAGISFERYRSVAFPVQYKLSRRPLYGVIAALVAWILSFGHCTIVIIVQYLPANHTSLGEDLPFCYDNFTPEQLAVVLPVRLELCLVLFFIPMVVTIFCHGRFVWIMLSLPQVGTQKRWRAVGLATVTLFNFLVCFGPYNVSHVIGFFQQTSEAWRTCAALLSALNACMDPLIFYFSSSAVRKAFHRRLRSMRAWGAALSGKQNRSEEPEKENDDRDRANAGFTEE